MPNTQPLKTGDPQRLGDYALSGRLGEGGQGVVFLGMRGEQTYAVKLLHGPVGDERAAFLREVELAKHVARFCTAQVVDAGFDAGRPYIVSEYVDGPSLHREVAHAGPKSGGALERLAVGTATALAAIHRAGIVHRDFKPQNVLLGPDGPRVIDFGLARALDAAATVSGRGVGTPAYMAPEQITASAVTGAADVFSWGATMCFAANAVAPFGQDSVAPVLHRILTALPELGRLDGQLRELVDACLDKDVRNRPTSRELLFALLGDSAGLPAEVLRSPPPPILRTDPAALGAPASDPAAYGDPASDPAAYGAPVSDPASYADPAFYLATYADPVSDPGHADPAVEPTPSADLPPSPDRPPYADRVAAADQPPSAGRSPFANASWRAGSGPLAEPEATGVPGGYHLPHSAVGHPSGAAGEWPGAGGGPEDTQDVQGRWRAQAANRAGLAVSCALLVSAAVLVTVLVPAFRQDGTPPQAAARPSGTPPPALHLPRPVSSGAVTEKQATKPRETPTTAPPPPSTAPVAVTVPGLMGLDRSAAIKALKRAGLAAGKVTQVDSAQKLGQVLASRPAAGSAVAKGAKVDLDVSAGLAVPAVTGLDRKAAEVALTGAGLTVGTISRTCSSRPGGQVLSTRPDAGTRVQGGTAVALVVAQHGATVPAVTGLGREEAQAALRAAGFTVRQRAQIVADPAEADVVLAQNVAEGTCAKPGRVIVITVGVAGQTIPDPGEPPDPTPTPTESE